MGSEGRQNDDAALNDDLSGLMQPLQVIRKQLKGSSFQTEEYNLEDRRKLNFYQTVANCSMFSAVCNLPKHLNQGNLKKQSMQSNKSTGRFQYRGQVMKCVLKANSKVVHFGSAGISLQDSQGSQPFTWIHHFRDRNSRRPLVTFTQKSRNKFWVLTKDKHGNNLKLYSYTHSNEEPDVQMLLNKGLEEHLFIKHTHEALSVSFECHGDRNNSRYLYVNDNLSMQHKKGNDLPDGQNYLFQLEKK